VVFGASAAAAVSGDDMMTMMTTKTIRSIGNVRPRQG
jgi:hypothetical protein